MVATFLENLEKSLNFFAWKSHGKWGKNSESMEKSWKIFWWKYYPRLLPWNIRILPKYSRFYEIFAKYSWNTSELKYSCYFYCKIGWKICKEIWKIMEKSWKMNHEKEWQFCAASSNISELTFFHCTLAVNQFLQRHFNRTLSVLKLTTWEVICKYIAVSGHHFVTTTMQ